MRDTKTRGLRRFSLLTIAALLSASASFAADPPTPERTPDTVGYAIGYDLGAEVTKGLAADGVQVNPDAVARGLADALRGQASTLTAEQVDALLVALHNDLAVKRVRARLETDPVFKALYDDNARRSKTFHENFAKKEGVVSLPSGCQYLVLRKGEGAPVGDAKKVIVNYRALTVSGAEFARGENAEMPIATINKGGQEVIRLMREGDRWQAAIPPALAFGEAGKDPHIGPNECLIAEVEIIRVVK